MVEDRATHSEAEAFAEGWIVASLIMIPSMRTFAALLGILVAAASCAAAEVVDPNGVEFFEARIRPIFVERCYECHSGDAKRIEGGLRLDSASALRLGGDSGPLVAPGKPEESFLIACVSYADDGVNMPPSGKLAARQIADLRKWVALGAPLPAASDAGIQAAPKKSVAIDEQARNYWAFRPPQTCPSPTIADRAWPRQKIDWFVRRKLEEHGFQPAPPADRRTLIRRVTFDLIGLPATFAEVEEFAADTSLDAYERLVERLLASPHYGERWGRHWLDVARYGEDNPTDERTNPPPRFPYRYRDWVVKALNDDLPYHAFVRRQLAADLQPDLPPEELAATGFLGLSPVYHKEPRLSGDVTAMILADEWDERVDTITRGLLGLTVACARCHDHKFDPIRTQDYYALAGVMASTRLVERPLAVTDQEEMRRLQDTHDAIVDVELRLRHTRVLLKTAAAAKEPTAPLEAKVRDFEVRLEELQSRTLFAGAIANGVCDSSVWIDDSDPVWTAIVFRPDRPRDLPVFVRGNPSRPDEIVPRRFLEVLSSKTPRPFTQGSGRLELADAIVGEAAGLTARVIVNRIWGWHLGKHLVRTPSNFGALGDPPSHPELLDDLAARFVESGWSLKWLHREIVLSATYRQSSVHPLGGGPHDPALVDGDNRLLWRMNRRRLEPEAWRDAVLSVSGRLDLAMGGPSANLDDPKNVRRTIYGKVSRQNAADVLRLFDFPDAKQHAEERTLTTTPLQQLYLLNSEFMRQNAEAVVRAEADPPRSMQERLRAAFRRVLQREPSPEEGDAAGRLLRRDPAADVDPWCMLVHGLLASNEFLHVD
jgi:hypothetical protein